MLHYSPLLGGGGFNEPTVTLHAAVNPRYASGDGGDHLFFNGASGSEPGMQGVLVTHAAPMPLSLDDEASTMVSIPTAGGFATSFPFLGEHHTSLNIASNGYVTFGPPPTAVASEATSESQFSVDKGPSFSLLLADLKVPNVHVTHLERVGKSYAATPTERSSGEQDAPQADSVRLTAPFATVVTYMEAEVETFGTEEGNPTATVQAFFEHDTGAISVVFGKLPAGIEAIVGPSVGDGEDEGAGVTSIAKLQAGLLSRHGSANKLCDELGEEGEDDE